MHDGPVLFRIVSICLSISVFRWHVKRLVAFHFLCCEYAWKRRIPNRNGVLGVWEEKRLIIYWILYICIMSELYPWSKQEFGMLLPRLATTITTTVTTTANNVLAWFHVARIIPLDWQETTLQKQTLSFLSQSCRTSPLSRNNSKWWPKTSQPRDSWYMMYDLQPQPCEKNRSNTKAKSKSQKPAIALSN